MDEYAVVGKGLPRLDARIKVTGSAIYTVDVALRGMLHGKILRSPHPHARILNIDVSRAAGLPGVKAIITGKDVSTMRNAFVDTPRYPADHYPLAQDKVRYVGDEVAAVAAIDEDTALEALDLIEVDYEALPAVFTPEESLRTDAPILHEHPYEGVSAWEDWGQKPTATSKAELVHPNVSGHTFVSFGDVDRAFADSYLVRQDRFVTTGTAHCPMEPHSCVADYDASGKLNLYISAMAIFYKRFILAKAMGIPISRVRVLKTYVGGAFGGKVDVFPYEIVASVLSMRTGRPVKIEMTREEVFTTTRQRHPSYIDVKTGVTRDGLILGQEYKFVVDNGGYRGSGPVVVFLAFSMNNPVYRIPNVRYEGTSVYTNNPIRGPQRGHGAPQMRFAVDSQLHMIAEELGLDPVEVMLRNARQKGEVLPSIGDTLNSCGLSEAIVGAARDSNWKEIWSDSSRREGPKKRGIGISLCAMFSGSAYYPFASAAVVKLDDDGAATLFTGATEFGQGIETTLSQVAAEELHIGLGDMKVISGDTETCPIDIGNFLSAGALVSGNAVRLAAQDAMRQLLQTAADLLEAMPEDLEARDKRIYVKGVPDKSLPYAQVIHASVVRNNGNPIIGRGHYQSVQGVDRNPSLARGKGRWTDAYGFAAQVAEVEVDTETGHVKLIKATTHHDCGYPLNRQIVEGQIEGCVSNGQGQAMSEIIDMREGQMMNPSFLTYGMPTCLEGSEIRDGIVASVEPKGPFGAKEVGEGALAGMLGAVANAVYDATGVRITSLPITPDKILEGLEGLEQV
ncbi:MAG: xanthine dehydrogenase family protein molybdopterin-binding subunit [Chloroflexi bacterium]|nr:xanthine dehydrogenase family protein molybdopterin-binding subunit [Chloroflexota bacterium]